MLSAVFIGVGLVLAYRLFDLQVLQHSRFADMAREERLQASTIPAHRGALLDTNGHPLAVSVLYDTVLVAGSQVENPAATAAALAPLLELDPNEILQKIDPESQALIPLKRGLPSAVAAQVKALGRAGVYLREEPARQYPEGSLAAQVLGLVGADSEGLLGLELAYDDELAGQPGLVESERDATGLDIGSGNRRLIEPRQGADLVLTLDRAVQRMAERTLAEAVVANKALGGLILVMEPSTGSVIAMASSPTYSLTDEVHYQPGQESLYKSVYVTDQYEPGSVMKVITMAAGLQEGVVTATSTVNDRGSVEVGGAVLRNWDFQANGTINMTEVLIRSSNVGAQYVSGLLGPDRFYSYLDAFGFGKKTDVRLPGEVSGTVRTPAEPDWGRVDLATNSYGQGIAVTPLQMLTAISAIANNGVLMKPRLVRELRRGSQAQRVEPEPVRQVISPTTAQTLTGMLVQVLEQPALQPNRVPGYRFAGKTGTADLPTSGGYTSGKTYASIVAYGPLPEPRFSILIRIDAPEAIYGGLVAGPILKRMLQELVVYYRIPAAPAPTRTPART